MYTFLPQTIIWTHKSPCALEHSAHSYHINQSFVYGHGPLLLLLAIVRGSQCIHSPIFVVLLRAPHRVLRTLLSMPFPNQQVAISFVSLPHSKHDQSHHHLPRHCGSEQHKHCPPKALGVRLHYILIACVTHSPC